MRASCMRPRTAVAMMHPDFTGEKTLNTLTACGAQPAAGRRQDLHPLGQLRPHGG